MKILCISILVAFISISTFANSSNKKKGPSVADSHSSIYTTKVKRIVNAINIGDYTTDSEYYKMLSVACKRNQCSSLEKQTIRAVGKQIVLCKITHLKAHGIENPDATNICESKQAMFGCDSLANPLFRKMCYAGNNYSLNILKTKELKMKKRSPASAHD